MSEITSMNSLQPKYPIYIISKGRYESRLTSRALEKMNVPYHIVVEPAEYEKYTEVIDKEKIYQLPSNLSELGQGSIPARNWVLNHARASGEERHWIMDDNIRSFQRLNNNTKIRVGTGAYIRAMEDFCDRYTNIMLAGPHYTYFAPRKLKFKPLIFNSRIYSCILINNAIPYEWRGRYNEDTDLSLRVLKDGYCTVLFRGILQEKAATLSMKGGNTDTVYTDGDQRFKFTESLRRQHPDVVSVVRKYGRWHHSVDYRPFKYNKLIKKEGIIIGDKINDYGMKLSQL